MPQNKSTVQDPGLGYPQIEKLIEAENFETINKSFAEAYNKLEAIKKDRSGGLKKQKSAQKAMQSYELTTQLINELLQVKYQLIKAKEEEAKKGQKK
ncbi:MAG: hypothetical protein HQM16_13465 [Deltaproteobacteria bacterium]|nr:hypothetical protein [Deltaproteobacteria bacterium]